MPIDKRICSICAWRGTCQKRYTVATDAFLNVHCPDYSRDVLIKDRDLPARLVEEQLGKWKEEKREGDFLIAISRETGSGGSQIARILAKQRNMDLIGGQIIQKIAESSKISEKVIKSLDEKAVSAFDNLLSSMFVAKSLSPNEYFRYLVIAIGTIGKHGNAIVMGRGANFILPPERTFKLRVVAPLETRIKNVMEDRDLSKEEAQKYIVQKDKDRDAFVKKYFNEDVKNTSHYDLVINSQGIMAEKVAVMVNNAFEVWKSTRAAPGG
jgi:cytidylate kinase